MLPGVTLLSLVVLFAAFALLSGAVSVLGAVRNKTRDDDWWLPLLWGLVSIGAGALAVMHPGLSVLILVLVIGGNAMITGVLDIVTAIRLRKTITGEWLLALSGLVSIIFGFLVFLFPGPGAVALVWMIAIYAIFTGGLLLGLSIRLRFKTKARPYVKDRRITPERRVSHAHS
jgi:uncharacterized membrane protein HdeD (DUF308 family)